jgi:hypothetical protein
MTEERHTTHVERDGHGRYYWWCEASNCFANDRTRYATDDEAIAAAVWHSEHPG